MSPASPALAPFEPSPSDPFDRRKAAHLLRRAGFGASPSEVSEAVERGLEGAVESLFDAAEAEKQEAEFQATFAAVSAALTSFEETEGLQAWWVYRMARTRVPLREKLTLFWHGHFATSDEKVENTGLMHDQVETIRRHAWGNVRDLTLAMAKDPAMIVWLDGESNSKRHPNENFARELMELFTCGIGHFTEKDVKEAARAFTGWHRDGASFAFHPEDHDNGRKTFLGRSGRLDGADVVDILMQHPATPRALAAKLLRFFSAPEPPAAVVDEAAALFVRTRLDVKWFLRELFMSRWFYSPECYRTRLASPVEYVVGSVRSLGVRWAAPGLVDHLDKMGQRLYQPPNVKGWDGERRWINSGTWAARQAFADELARLDEDNPLADDLDLGKTVPADVNDPEKVIEALADALLQGDLSAEARSDLAELLVTADEGENGDDKGGTAADAPGRDEASFRDDEGVRAARTRRALGVLLSLPECHAY
jgi:uncharacterized protein (DUF1800 family)